MAAEHLINIKVRARLESAGLGSITSQANAELEKFAARARQIAAMPAGAARTQAVGEFREEYRQFRMGQERAIGALPGPNIPEGASAKEIARINREWTNLGASLARQFERVDAVFKRLIGSADEASARAYGAVETSSDVRRRMELAGVDVPTRGVAEAAGGIREEGAPEASPQEVAQARAGAALREGEIQEAILTTETDYVTATAILTELRRRVALLVEQELVQSGPYVATLAQLKANRARLNAAVEEEVASIRGYVTDRARSTRATRGVQAGVRETLAEDPTDAASRGRILVADRWGRAKTLDTAATLGLAAASVEAERATNEAKAAIVTAGTAHTGLRQSTLNLEIAETKAAAAHDRDAASSDELAQANLGASRARRTRRVRVIRDEGADTGIQQLSAEERLLKLQNANEERRRLLANPTYTKALQESARLAEQERALRKQAVEAARAEATAAERGAVAQQGATREVTRFQRLMATLARRGVGPHAIGPGGGSESPEELAARMPRLGQFLGQRAVTTAGFAATGLVFRALTTGISAVIQQAEALQRQFALVQAQFNSIGQGAEFPEFRKNVLQIARDLGVSGEEAAYVAFQIKGVYGADTQRAIRETEAALRASVVTGLAQKEIVDSLTAASLAFRDSLTGEAISIDDITDKSIGLEERFGVLSQESIKFFGDIADTAAAAGLNLDELGQIAGVMQQKLAVGGGALAENVGRILGAMQENSVKVLETFTRFPQLAAQLPDVQRFVGRGQTGPLIFQLAKNWDQLSASQQKSIAISIGGQRQYRAITATLGGLNQQIAENKVYWDESSQSFKDQANDQGKAAARQKSLNETLTQQLNRLKEGAKQFGDALFESGVGDFLVMATSAGRMLLDVFGGALRLVGELNQAFGGVPGKIILITLALRAVMATIRAMRGMSLTSLLTGGLAGGEGGVGRAPRLGGLGQYLGAAAEVGGGGFGGLRAGLKAGGLRGLGQATATTLGGVLPTLGVLGFGVLASISAKRQAQEEEMATKFKAQLDKGDKADKEAIQRIAEKRASTGQRIFTGITDPEALWSGIQHLGHDLTFGLIPDTKYEVQTPDVIARQALEAKERQERGSFLRGMLGAEQQVTAPIPFNERTAPFAGLPGLPTASGGMFGGIDLNEILGGTPIPTINVPLLDLKAELEKRKGEGADVDKFLKDLAAGDEDAVNTAQAIQDDLVAQRGGFTQEEARQIAERRERIQGLLKQQQTGGQAALRTIQQAEADYALGRIGVAELINIQATNLKSMEDALAEDPNNEALQDSVNAARQKIRDARHKAVEERTSGRLKDVAGQGDPQKDAQTALQNARDELDFLRKEGATVTELNNAEAAVRQAERGVKDADNDVTIAQIKNARVKIGTAENALEDAKTQQALAQNAIDNAKGTAAKLDAEAEKARADKQYQDALFAIDQSRRALLEARYTAAGQDIQAAVEADRQVQAELRRALNTPGTGIEVINQLRARAVQSQDQLSATRVSETKELIDFQLDMGEITVGQAIAQLQALLGSPDVQSNANRVREIRSAIRSLQKQTQGDLQFNIGDLRLPTLYEVRRTEAIGAQGGYSDNRNVRIDISVYNQGDLDQALETFTAAVNAPSRYGTAPRVYPSAYN